MLNVRGETRNANKVKWTRAEHLVGNVRTIGRLDVLRFRNQQAQYETWPPSEPGLRIQKHHPSTYPRALPLPGADLECRFGPRMLLRAVVARLLRRISLVAADGSRTEVTLPLHAAERLVSDLQAHIVRGRSESQG